jgi:hypothetical protein
MWFPINIWLNANPLPVLRMRESTPDSSSENSSTRSTREQLSALLRAAFRGGLVETAPLREAVCTYVDGARERGEPVERVIVDLKRMMELSGAWHRSASRNEEAIAEGIIRWCIDRYYKPADSPRDD